MFSPVTNPKHYPELMNLPEPLRVKALRQLEILALTKVTAWEGYGLLLLVWLAGILAGWFVALVLGIELEHASIWLNPAIIGGGVGVTIGYYLFRRSMRRAVRQILASQKGRAAINQAT